MTTNLLGRRARGRYIGVNPKYDEKRGRQPDNEYWVGLSADGEIVGVFDDMDDALYVIILDGECRLRKCCFDSVVVLPRDFAPMNAEGRL